MSLAKEAASIPDHIIDAAKKDRFIGEDVHGQFSEDRVPIHHEGNVVGFFTPRKVPGGPLKIGTVFIHPEHRGKGLAAKAVSDYVGDRHASTFIRSDNPASRKALTAAGFVQGEAEDRFGGGHWFKKNAEREHKVPKAIKHRAEAIMRKGHDKSTAYAIAVKQSQREGRLKPGTHRLTSKGKKWESKHRRERR